MRRDRGALVRRAAKAARFHDVASALAPFAVLGDGATCKADCSGDRNWMMGCSYACH